MNPVTLITGASQGIGAATAELLAAKGHRLLIHYAHRADLAQSVANKCIALGAPAALIAQADLAHEADILRLFAFADAHLPPLTGLVNNAGIVGETLPLEAFSAARITQMMAVNVVGPMLCAREAILRMSPNHGGQGGVIVNLSSSAVRSGSPNIYVDYAASKGAIDVFTHGLAKEVAPQGIRVCGVRPGITDTGIHATGGEPDRAHLLGPSLPMGRAAQPMEVAQAVAWLLTDEASYTAGAIIDVTGAR